MPPVASNDVVEVVKRFSLHYTWLANHAMTNGRLMWNITTKFLFFWHLAAHCQYYNPREGWTYKDEDFVGRIALVARSVARGLGPLRLGPSLLYKYRRMLFIRFKRQPVP